MTCPDCHDTGRVGNGLSGPAHDDMPCPNPDCAEGQAERDDHFRYRLPNGQLRAEPLPSLATIHPLFADIVAPFAPLEEAA